MKTRDRWGEYAQPEMMPRVANLDPGMLEIRARKPIHNTVWRLIKWGGIALILIIVAVIVIAVVQTRSQQALVTEQAQNSYNPAFRVRYAELGGSVITAWYSGSPAVIDYSSSVKWPTEGSPSTAAFNPYAETQQTAPPATAAGTVPLTPNPSITALSLIRGREDPIPGSSLGPNSYAETLTYSALFNGEPVTIDLVIGIPDIDDLSSRPILLSSPTLNRGATPSAVAQNGAPTGDDYAALPAPSAATLQQLTRWAAAWAENDSSDLKQLTQDQSNRVYTGLGDWKLVTASSSGSAPVNMLWQFNRTIDRNQYAVARVTFNIEQRDRVEIAPTDSRTVTYGNQQTMDVLIGGYNSGLPFIAAWGPAGSWDSLTPYGNGVVSTSTPAVPTTTAQREPVASSSSAPTSASPVPTTAAAESIPPSEPAPDQSQPNGG